MTKWWPFCWKLSWSWIIDQSPTFTQTNYQNVWHPNHLLFSRRLESRSLSNHDTSLTVTNPTKYFPQINQLLEHFWNRWRQEYLTELRVQHRQESREGQSISLNDIVLVYDDKLPRSLWRIGKVIKLSSSKDNKVRGADVRLPNSSILKRPVNKLYPIEYSPHIDNTNNVSKSANPVEANGDDRQSKGVRRSRR